MNKSMKIALLAAAAAGIIFYFISRDHSDDARPIVKIGATLPLTGDVAMLGKSAQQALVLAQERLGELEYEYELVFEDDQFKPSIGATTANKLIGIDGVSALLSFGSPVGNAVAPIAEKAKVPHINFFASDTNVAEGEFNFLHYTPPYEDSRVFIEELRKRDINTLVFFGQQDNPGVGAIIDAFEKDIEGTDIKVLSTQKFNTGTRDFRTLIGGVKELDPDIYVLEASSPELEVLTRQLRESGIQAPVTTMEAFEFSDQLSLFEGMWYVNAADPQQWFVDLYAEKHDEAPKFGAANGYDAFNMIVAAVEEAGDGKSVPSREEIARQLASIKEFDGALGDDLSVDENGLVVSGAVVRIIQDGKPVTVGK